MNVTKSRVAFGLAVLTIAVFARVLMNDFVNYDDPDYVTANPFIQRGLSWDGIHWAFANLHGSATYWHPITWLSHMMDVQLFGLKPAGHHAMNLVFHTANVMLLFALLVELTGSIARSAFIAAVFAVHPLQVDTVAWITERKNVLSGLFWFLTLLAYCHYVRKRNVACYLLVFICFVLGLMCKPVLVTLPAALLLLDVWPLRRWSWAAQRLPAPITAPVTPLSLPLLLLEKLPFFALSIASGLITVMSHEGLGISQESHGLPLELRLQNAFVSYARYLGKFFAPVKLAVLYPHPGKWPDATVWSSFGLLALLTILAVWHFRRRPYLLIGWLWFLGVLFPASGVLQVGVQAMADRFIYLPMVGLLIAFTWLACDVLESQYPAQNIKRLQLAAAFAVAISAALTWQQIGFWKNSFTLWEHTIAVTGPNPLANNNLAYALFVSGNYDAALNRAREAARLRPDFGEPRLQMGMIYEAKRQMALAIDSYQEALKIHSNWPLARSKLADALAKSNRPAEAIAEYESLLKLLPGDPETNLRLAQLFSATGSTTNAVAHYREALKALPNQPETLNNLAWILATSPRSEIRNGSEAVALAQRACELTQRRQPLFIGTLAAAYAENGQFQEAIAAADEASARARSLGQGEIDAANQRLKKLYIEHKPFRDEPQ